MKLCSSIAPRVLITRHIAELIYNNRNDITAIPITAILLRPVEMRQFLEELLPDPSNEYFQNGKFMCVPILVDTTPRNVE